MQLTRSIMEVPDAEQGEGRARTQVLGGVLLCGGRSLRMGTDKARLLLDGVSLLECTAALLREVCGEVVLACGEEPRYVELGLPLVLDGPQPAPDPGRSTGPLAGLVAGLEALDTELTLAIACDMPRLERGLLRALEHRAREERLDACFLSSERGREPLCAVYSRRCVEPMRRALAAGRRRVTAFLDEVGFDLRVGELRLEELEREGILSAARLEGVLTNLNTPQELELERARRVEDGS